MQLALFYRAADLLVLPTLEETFSFTLAEALSCGLPVVASRVAAVPETMGDGQGGLLVPPGDPEALAQAVSRLLADAGLRRRLSQQALARATAHLSSDTMIDRYLKWFAEICGQRSAAAPRVIRSASPEAR